MRRNRKKDSTQRHRLIEQSPPYGFALESDRKYPKNHLLSCILNLDLTHVSPFSSNFGYYIIVSCFHSSVNQSQKSPKNLFYFSIDRESKFGPSSEQLLFCPINYSFINNRIANTKYRINSMPEEYKDWIKEYEKVLVNLEKTSEPLKANILGMKKRPY